MPLIRFAGYRSPMGTIFIAGGDTGITDLALYGGRRAFLRHLTEKHGVKPQEDTAFFASAFSELDIYFSGRPVRFALPLAPSGTEFELKVWTVIKRIPWGSTLSYKELAERIGNPAASRAVGGACGKNPIPLIIPCHRVLASTGGLGGYTGGLDIKKRLLGIEGAL